MLSLILLLVVVGVALYLVELIPMDGTIKRIIQILVILLVVLYIFEVLFGISLPLRGRL
jgi:hypothetical protein